MNHTQENTGIDFSESETELIHSGLNLRFMERTYLIFYPILSWAIVATGIFGLLGNVLTLFVYTKLGFSESIHMSYAALAVSDIGCVLTMVWIRVCYWPVTRETFLRHGLQVDVGLLANFTGGWPNLGFTRTTALLTAWISLERCLCVIFPTRVKLIITPRVTKIVLLIIYMIGCCPVILAYVGFTIEIEFDFVSNYSTLFLGYSGKNQLSAPNTIAFFLYGAVYPFVSWVAVAVCTAVLIVKLKQSAKWRMANTTDNTKTSRKSASQPGKPIGKENRVTRTVLTIAVTFIVCSSPQAAALIVSAVWREFSLNTSLHFPFLMTAITSTFCNEINSSINIIVYSTTGSKFRNKLVGLLPENCRNVRT